MPDTTINLSESEQLKIITEASELFLNELNAFSPIFKEARDGYNYLAGKQMRQDYKDWFDKTRRPTNSFNLIFPIFNQVLGDFLINDQRTKVFHLKGGTPEKAELIQHIVDHANSANENDSESFLTTVAIAGLVKSGWIYTRWSDEKRVDGSIVMTDEDEFEIMYDSRSQNYFCDDAAYMFRSRWLTKKQIISEFSQHKTKLNALLADISNTAFWDSLVTTQGGIKINAIMQNPAFSNERRDQYRIVEYRKMEHEKIDVWFDLDTGNTEIIALEGKKADIFIELMKRKHPNGRVIERTMPIKKTALFIPGLNFFLSMKLNALQDKSHDLTPFSAYRYGRNKIEDFGIFRNAKEPQDDFNDWRNISRDVMAKNANPGALMRSDLIENPQDVLNHGGEPGLEVHVSSESTDMNQVYRLLDYSKVPFGPDQMSLEAADFLQKVTGVTPNLLGNAESKNEPASLFAQRVRQAQTALFGIYHNWSATKRRAYNKAIRYAQQEMPPHQRLLVAKPETPEERIEVIINTNEDNTISVGRYEVVAQDIDNHPTMQVVRFQEKSELIATIFNMLGPGAIDARWWLQDAPMANMDVIIERMEAVINGIIAQGGQDAAVNTTQQLMQLAAQRLQLEEPAVQAGPQQQS